MYYVVLPRPRLPDHVRRRDLRQPDPRELLPVLRLVDAARRWARVPHADLRARARPASRPASSQLRANRQIASSSSSSSRSCFPPSTRSRSRSRSSPSSSSSSSPSGSPCSWSAAGSAAGTKTGQRPEAEAPLGRLGRPRRGRPDPRGRGRDRGGRANRGGGDERGARRGERFPDAVILPGFVNAHSHLEYAVYAGFGDGLPFGPWIALHVERKQRLDLDAMEAIARLGALECLRSGHDGRGLQLQRAAATACAELGLAGRLPRGLRGGRARARPVPPDREGPPTPSRARRSGRLAPRAVHVHPRGLPRVRQLGLPIATHLAESEAETEFLRAGSGSWQPFADMLVPPLGQTAIRALAEAGLLGPQMLAAHCVQADEEEIELLAAHDVAVAHCPRSNALLGCGIAPSRAPRRRSGSASRRTARPRRRRSTCSTSCARRSRRLAPASAARTRSPRGRAELATLGGGARARRRRRDGLPRPGKRADLTVLSLARHARSSRGKIPLRRRFSGSPERVVATLVSGETRYERGGRHGSS